MLHFLKVVQLDSLFPFMENVNIFLAELKAAIELGIPFMASYFCYVEQGGLFMVYPELLAFFSLNFFPKTVDQQIVKSYTRFYQVKI